MRQCHLDNYIILTTWRIIFSPRFSLIHSFDKPNDETALRLMNACASLMMEQFPDIIFGYGFDNEYRYDLPLENCCVCMENTTKKTDKDKICVSAWHNLPLFINNSNVN